MNMKWLAAAAALIPLAGISVASEKAASGQTVSFETLDTNQDGRISMPEASADAKLVERFSTADKNGDGYLDNAEYDNSREPPK